MQKQNKKKQTPAYIKCLYIVSFTCEAQKNVEKRGEKRRRVKKKSLFANYVEMRFGKNGKNGKCKHGFVSLLLLIFIKENIDR